MSEGNLGNKIHEDAYRELGQENIQLKRHIERLHRAQKKTSIIYDVVVEQRDRLADSLRMISVADWKTAGELRNMARQAIMEGGPQ